jgi:hypothetical protein
MTKDQGRKTKGINAAFVIRHSSFVWAYASLFERNWT